ncbi:MAG: hypothetical protein MUP74_01010 [Desulfobacterales bacterium]|nr:hypothetical protein [Desulfobacterales bacterium]
MQPRSNHHCFDHYADDQLAMLANADPVPELLGESVKLYFRFLKKNPEIVRILAWMFLERDQVDCLQRGRELIEAGTAKIQAAQKSGYLRADIDPRFIVFTFISLAQHWFQDREHFIQDFGTGGLPEDLDEAFLTEMMRIFFEGVLPR